jgi:hypothetical protein
LKSFSKEEVIKSKGELKELVKNSMDRLLVNLFDFSAFVVKKFCGSSLALGREKPREKRLQILGKQHRHL